MNTQQARRVPLPRVLARLGYEPRRTVKGELWYLSPFRQETEASFKVNPERNIWYDFGAGQGGNVLDFVLQYYRLTSVSEALQALENLEGQSTPVPTAPVATPASPPPADTSFSISKVQPLQNRALIEYLNQRGIAADIARPYVQEMYYSRGDKRYFALAFPNQSGGWELRNRYFKGALGSKDISLVKPQGVTETSIAVFEGFMDFLSYLAYYRFPAPTLPVIVLNSVAMRDKAIAAIRDMGAREVRLYLDLDDSGKAQTVCFQQQMTGCAVLDQSGLYEGFKDFNAFLERS